MGLLRLVGILIVAVLAISVLRTVIGIVAKLFTGGTREAATRAPGGPPKVKAGGTLQRCPACGTLTSEAISVKRVEQGSTVYYCSQECAEKSKG